MNKSSQEQSQGYRNRRLDSDKEEEEISINGRDSVRNRGVSRVDRSDLDEMLHSGEVFEVNMASALSDPSADPDPQGPGFFRRGPDSTPSEQASVNAATLQRSNSSNSNSSSSSSSSASQGNISASTASNHTAPFYSNGHDDADAWNLRAEPHRDIPLNDNAWDSHETQHVTSHRNSGSSSSSSSGSGSSSKHVDDLWGKDYVDVDDNNNEAVISTSLNPPLRPSFTASQSSSSQSKYASKHDLEVHSPEVGKGVESNQRMSGWNDRSKPISQQRVASHSQQHTTRQPNLHPAPSSQQKVPSRQPLVAPAVSVSRSAMTSSSSPVNKSWNLPQLPPGIHRSPSGNSPSSSSFSSSSSSSSLSIPSKSNGIMPPPTSASRKRLRTTEYNHHSADSTGRPEEKERIVMRDSYRVGVGVQERAGADGGGGSGSGFGEQSTFYGENRSNNNKNNQNRHNQQQHYQDFNNGQTYPTVSINSSTKRNESLWGDFNMESKVPSPSPTGIFPVANLKPVIFDYKKDLDDEEW